MSCQNYKMIEMANDSIGAVAVNGFMPLGRVTRRLSQSGGCAVPFEVAASGADIVRLTSKGYYNVIYNASLAVTAGSAAAPITLTLLADGKEIASVTTTFAATGTYNLTLVKAVRVFANCSSCPSNCPMDLQVRLTGSAITDGKSTLRVDSCVNG